MYAVFKSGGKQYKVAEGEVVKLEKIDGEVGKVIQLKEVIALSDGNDIKVGEPTISGASVSAEVLDQKKDTKIIVFKKKRRHNYRRKHGHRQQITVVRILDVSGKGNTAKKAAPKAEPKKEEKKVEAKEVKKEAPKAAAKPAEKTEAKAAPKQAATKTEDKK